MDVVEEQGSEFVKYDIFFDALRRGALRRISIGVIDAFYCELRNFLGLAIIEISKFSSCRLPTAWPEESRTTTGAETTFTLTLRVVGLPGGRWPVSAEAWGRVEDESGDFSEGKAGTSWAGEGGGENIVCRTKASSTGTRRTRAFEGEKYMCVVTLQISP